LLVYWLWSLFWFCCRWLCWCWCL